MVHFRTPALALLLVTASGTVQAQTDWHRVESDVCGFSAQFPGHVSEQGRSVPLGDGRTSEERRFLAVDAERGFLAYCSAMPSGVLSGADRDELLASAVSGLGETAGPIEAVELEGHPGRAFVVRMEGGYSFGRAYVVGDTTLMLQVVDREAEAADVPEDARRFLDSVRLTASE